MTVRQRGIALLTAIILVAIATVLATAIGFSATMTARRASTVLGANQALLAAEGAEAMAAYVLKQSGINATEQDPSQPWGQPYGPYPLLPGVTLDLAQMEDEQGKFNINNLAPEGSTDKNAVQIFQQLLEMVGLEDKWAPLLADWIDTDRNTNNPGAEDDDYLSQSPPYRPANMPVTSITEIMALPGFGRERFNKIAPYITALPPGTKINVCSASGVLLDALKGSSGKEYSSDASVLADQRKNGCFPTVPAFTSGLGQTEASLVTQLIGSTTSYYRLRTYLTIGTAKFSLYSLMWMNGGNIRPILRTFGTE